MILELKPLDVDEFTTQKGETILGRRNRNIVIRR